MTELRPIAVQTIEAAIAGSACSFVVLLLKFFSRYRSKSDFGTDDALVALAWAITVPFAVSFYIRENSPYPIEKTHKSYDADRLQRVRMAWVTPWARFLSVSSSLEDSGTSFTSPFESLSPPPPKIYEQFRLTSLRWNRFWASSWMYFLALGLSKLSVTLQFFRIFVTPKTLLVTKCTIAFVISWTIVSACVAAFECVPVERYWDKRIPGKCINGRDTFITNGVMNIVTDFVIIGIPVPSLLKLQVSAAKKIGLLFAFSLGAV